MGGCAVDLLLTDPAAAPARVTYDVDLVARVEALSGYHALEVQFAQLGFKRDMAQDAPICRWHYNNLEVDLMPMVYTPANWRRKRKEGNAFAVKVTAQPKVFLFGTEEDLA